MTINCKNFLIRVLLSLARPFFLLKKLTLHILCVMNYAQSLTINKPSGEALLNKYFQESGKKTTKSLVVGIGGGNDMYTSGLVISNLLKLGAQVDVAGILSPMAIHTFKGKIEEPINQIKGKVERFLHFPVPVQIPFVDAFAPKFYASVGIKVGKCFDFSIRFGTEKLIKSLEKLIQIEGYDLVVAVDVGGDVFARGEKDSTLLTPLADFAMLHCISCLDVDSAMVELGFGTDCELRPTGMSEILAHLRNSGMLISEHRLSSDDSELIAFKKLYKKVSAIRKGNTMGRLIQTFESDKDLPIRHCHHSQIGGKSWKVHYESVVPGEYAGMAYIVNLKMLAESRKEMAFAFENQLEQYVRMKRITAKWATELDLGYLWSCENWVSPYRQGYSLQLLVPSARIPHEARMEIIIHGIRNAEADFVLILKEDLQSVSRRIPLSGYFQSEACEFVVLSRRSGEREFAEGIAVQIRQYCR
jgi:hypothetical protein